MMNGEDGGSPMEDSTNPDDSFATPTEGGLQGNAQINLADAALTPSEAVANPASGQLSGMISGQPAGGGLVALGQPLPEKERSDQKSFIKGLAIGFGILILMPVIAAIGETIGEPHDDYFERMVSAEDLADGHHEIFLPEIDWSAVDWMGMDAVNHSDIPQKYTDMGTDVLDHPGEDYSDYDSEFSRGVFIYHEKRFTDDQDGYWEENMTVVGGWNGANQTIWFDIVDPEMRIDFILYIDFYYEPPIDEGLMFTFLCFGVPIMCIALIVKAAQTNKAMAMGIGAGFLSLPVIFIIACFGIIFLGGGLY